MLVKGSAPQCSAGPFDSLVGAHVLANALVAEVADRRRREATRRLDRLERIWQQTGVLED
jgi:DNA-binding MurR/RpiR family transcriptional regulator